MALQGTEVSLSTMQVVGMHTHEQHSAMPVSRGCPGYSTSDSTQLKPTISLSFVQAADNTHGQNAVGMISLPTSSAVAGMRQVGQVVLQSQKEEQGLPQEQERRIRREIANSNERRRMQSINAGFKSLKSVLPHTDGEKLSKAAILQQTSDYITQLESDKLKLMHQNEKLREAFVQCKCDSAKRRALADLFEKDEGIGSPAEEDFEDIRRGLVDVRQQLDKERRLRILYEEQVRNLENQLYPDRVRTVKLSSGDERRSSSECNPYPVHPVLGLTVTAKPQSCARPLLPPLAPLFSKLDKPNGVLQSLSPMKPAGVSLSVSMQNATSQAISASSNMATTQCELEYTSADKKSLFRNDNLVTVFSHSTKSNQPLKKRAIEIHHQSLSDSGNDSSTQQPERKIAKIAIGHSEKTETRPILPVTLQGVSKEHSNVPVAYTSLSTTNINSPVVPAGIKIDHIVSPPAASIPQLQNHSLLVSQPALPQFLPSQYASQLARVSAGPALMMPSVSSEGGIASTAPPQADVIASPVGNALAKTEPGVYAFVEKVPEINGCSSPMYLSIQPQGANIAYIQQDGDKLVQMAQQPHYVVTPMNSPGTVFVPPQSMTKDAGGEVIMPVQHQHVVDKMQPTIVAYHSAPPLPTAAPAMSHSLPATNPTQVSSAPPQAFLQASTMQRFQASPQIQSHQTVVCYCRPEITLNQLNAVPNLTLQKNFHQPVLVPSLVQPNGGDSPSYASPTLQEYVLQKNVLMNSEVLRCRKSSLNSSSTASGTEEDDQASSQTGQSKLSIMKRMEPSKSRLSVQGISVAAYDEVSESFTPEKQGPDAQGLSGLPEVAGSPPAMCRLGAMQTRRNLETIVQAIDHLEQQERRNSQDRCEAYGSEDGKSKAR